MKSSIYILIENNNKIFKIGKANNVLVRYEQLNKHYSFNLEKSYEITTTQKEVLEIEKILHLMFSSFNIKDLPSADGYTEFFDICCLDDVLIFLNEFKTRKNVEIKKGIFLEKRINKAIKRNAILSKEDKELIEINQRDRELRKLKTIARLLNGKTFYLFDNELVFDYYGFENDWNKQANEIRYKINNMFKNSTLLPSTFSDFTTKVKSFEINTLFLETLIHNKDITDVLKDSYDLKTLLIKLLGDNLIINGDKITFSKNTFNI